MMVQGILDAWDAVIHVVIAADAVAAGEKVVGKRAILAIRWLVVGRKQLQTGIAELPRAACPSYRVLD